MESYRYSFKVHTSFFNGFKSYLSFSIILYILDKIYFKKKLETHTRHFNRFKSLWLFNSNRNLNKCCNPYIF